MVQQAVREITDIYLAVAVRPNTDRETLVMAEGAPLLCAGSEALKNLRGAAEAVAKLTGQSLTIIRLSGREVVEVIGHG